MEWKRDYGLTTRIMFTWFLLLLVYLVFLAALQAILGFSFHLLVAIAFVMAFGQYFFSARLVLMSTGARVVEEDEYPELHRMVERLCAIADLPKPRIAIMQSPVPNAFATGRNPKDGVVAVTDSIMRILTKEELEGVLAHELAHIKNRDMMSMTIASFLAMAAALIVQNALFASLFDRREGNPWMIAWIVAILVYVAATLLIRTLSRYREFTADRGAAYITNNPRALQSALMKISNRMDSVPAEKKHEVEGANAFFIIPALTGKSLMELFSTHPPLEKRIAELEKVQEEIRGY
ncbi:heat shock protein HtpX [Methanocalculus alkaliphilus]|uniref:zinc metalloprotease HtpX n=1 Tax=Methanocalculus alkaliphilus TaxID=768730 RepID=UPI00209CC6B0|nr:zinc metalloprotease HtpX [Methanocalculus alkaliphilus]MCP1715672.1 heat shock protein HtpX [Methanocalculus alkaliphilus]